MPAYALRRIGTDLYWDGKSMPATHEFIRWARSNGMGIPLAEMILQEGINYSLTSQGKVYQSVKNLKLSLHAKVPSILLSGTVTQRFYDPTARTSLGISKFFILEQITQEYEIVVLREADAQALTF